MITSEIARVTRTIQEAQLLEDFNTIQMPRSAEALKRWVVGVQHIDAPERGWAQAVLEMQIKYDDIRRATLHARRIEIEIAALLEKGDELSQIDADLKRIDLEAQDRAMLGAIREFDALYAIYLSYGRRFTRAELDAAEAPYWRHRIQRQASQETLSKQTGIGPGNLECTTLLEDEALTLGVPGEDVRTRYFREGRRRVLIFTPSASAEPPADPTALPTHGLLVPSGVDHKLHMSLGVPIDDAYTHAVEMALREGCTHLFTVEDDTFPPADALVRLMKRDMAIVGGWYPKRAAGVRQGVPIVLRAGVRCSLDEPDDAPEMVECYTLPMGCTLYKIEVFQTIAPPWFVTSPGLSQDSYVSQLAREAGFTLWCDTTLRCRHIDRVTKEVFA